MKSRFRVIPSQLGWGILFFVLLVSQVTGAATPLAAESNDLHFVSSRIEIQFAAQAPGLDALDIDGLGLGKRGTNVLREQLWPYTNSPDTNFTVVVSTLADGKKADYRRVGQSTDTPSPWSIEANESTG